MAFNIFRSTDTDAPVLSAALGSIINVLDACLVNGYATKTPLGWSKAFSGTNKAVYTNVPANGNPIFLQVRDNMEEGATNEGEVAEAFLYESMADLDNGTGQIPNMAGSANTYAPRIPKSNAGGSTDPRDWVVIGNERFFYLWVKCSPTNTNDNALFAVGEYNSLIPADPYAHILISGQERDYTYLYYPRDNPLFNRAQQDDFRRGETTNYKDHLQRDYQGANVGEVTGGVSVPAWYTSGYSGDMADDYGVRWGNPAGAILHNDIYVVENISILRGLLPGIKWLNMTRENAVSEDIPNHGDSVVIDGKTYEFFQCAYDSLVLIQTDPW